MIGMVRGGLMMAPNVPEVAVKGGLLEVRAVDTNQRMQRMRVWFVI